MELSKRSARIAILAWLIVALLQPSVVAADDDADVGGARPAAAGGDTEGKVTLDVVDRPLKDVVDYVRDLTVVNLFVSAEAEAQKVTIVVRDMPWRTFLELVAEKTGCVIDARDPSVIKIERPPRVTFSFEDTEVKKVIQLIADYSGANIVIAPHVEGLVNVSLRDIPWRDALETIVKTLGYVVVEEDRGILRIMSPSMLIEQMETRVFIFKYVRPPEPIVAKIETEVSEGGVPIPDADVEKEFTLLKAFRAAVAPDGTLEYIKATNAIVVTAPRPKLARLEELIKQVDVEPQQVFVNIQFVSTTNTDFLDYGVDPGSGGIGASITGGAMAHRLPFNLNKGGLLERIAAEPDGPLPLAAGTGFRFGELSFEQTQLTLRLLKQDETSRFIQAPKLIALDNHVATIFVGETIRYARTEAESSQAGGLQFSIDEADGSPVQTGFQMLVIPHVIPGENRVMMTVIPQSKRLTGTSTTLPGFDEFRSGAGANEVSILLPREQSSTVVTHMILESGQTAVLGGLLTDRDSENKQGIPFLGDLPIFGFLFSNTTHSITKDHLMIFITPRIIRNPDKVRGALQRELDDRRKAIEEEFDRVHGGGMLGK